MFNPAVVNFVSQFHPLGNTPAVNLARGLPQGLDADLLLLGCGDARNILFTAYSSQHQPPRKFDITCCDIEPAIHARNIVLFSLLLDEGDVDFPAVWRIYYDLYLDEGAERLLQEHVNQLLEISGSLLDWRKGQHGQSLQFCDETSLKLVRAIWSKYASTAGTADARKTSLDRELKRAKDGMTARFGSNAVTDTTAVRSAAPLSLLSGNKILKASGLFWEQGALSGNDRETANPLFAATLSPNFWLHYGTEPLLGFHLATALANLAPSSPLKFEDPKSSDFSGLAGAAKTQFTEWAKSYRAESQRRSIKLRFVVADALTFCHVFQGHNTDPACLPNLYRRQFDMSTCDLDPHEYSQAASAPAEFDVIDTSNLADYFGALNLLVEASPLLKNAPSSTLYLETLVKKTNSREGYLDELLAGHAPTVSLLLGMTLVEQWTNATDVSSVDEMLLNLSAGGVEGQRQAHRRLAWKRGSSLSLGQSTTNQLLHMEPETFAAIIYQIYLKMFEHESTSSLSNLSPQGVLQKMRNGVFPPYHRGSFVSLMQVARRHIDTAWDEAYRLVINLIGEDRQLQLGSLYNQEFSAQLHLQRVFTEPSIERGIRRDAALGGPSAWKDISAVVVLTMVVARKHIDKFFATEDLRLTAPSVECHILSDTQAWQNNFAATHIAFGKTRTTGRRDDDEFAVEVELDKAGWGGVSPLVVAFYVPTFVLQQEPRRATVALNAQLTTQNVILYRGVSLGPRLSIYETSIMDTSRVFITKHMPGMKGGPGHLRTTTRDSSQGNPDYRLSVSLDTNQSRDQAVGFTGRADVLSEKGKSLLTGKASIELRQSNPFTIDIVFGGNAVIIPITYPLPVSKERSKTRIARKSSYIEVIAPLANPLDDGTLSESIFPVILGRGGLPVTLNSEHLSLDTLPVLNVEPAAKNDNEWMTTLASHMYSVRERRIRDTSENRPSGQAFSANLRINFKESLFTMFMLTAGLQGGQTGLFALSHPKHGNVMLIFVRAIRLNGAAASFVADAAVLPMTRSLVDSGKLEEFFLVLRELQICAIKVNDEELRLWRRVLPVLVESCRTWSHTEGCEYKAAGASIPLSLDPERQFICSCGAGKLPDDYMSLPEWDVAARHATRVAISPVFSSALLEDIVDEEGFKALGGVSGMRREKCRKCGKVEEVGGGKLMKCGKCKEVAYCSKNCQKADWKKHRMECT